MPTDLPLTVLVPQVLRHTPLWVWGLLAALVALGLSQRRERVLGRGRVLALPIAMGGWSLWSAAQSIAAAPAGAAAALGALPLALPGWTAGLLLVMAALHGRAAPAGLRHDAASGRFHVPGSLAPLALILFTFCLRYLSGVALALHPAWRGSAALALGLPLLFGALSGLWAARAAAVLGSARNGPARRAMAPTLAALGLALGSVAVWASTQSAAVASAGQPPSPTSAGTAAAAWPPAVGRRELPALAGTGPVTLWYPTAAAERRLDIGPFRIEAAPDAEPLPGRRPLIVLSHGSGGSALPEHDLARALVAAGFVVAAVEHAGDHWRDMRDAGPVSWSRRPRELSALIDRLAGDVEWSPRVDTQRVGVYGMSAGGLSALSIAGARWSLARIAAHCAQHGQADARFCLWQAEANDDTRRERLDWLAARRQPGADDGRSADARDPRVKAVVAAVPVAAPVEPDSLASLPVDVGLVVADADEILIPRWHALGLLPACARCTVLATLPGGAHDSVLSPWPASVAQAVGLSRSGSTYDRAGLPAVHRTIAAFFADRL